jgi:hypothetical protein
MYAHEPCDYLDWLCVPRLMSSSASDNSFCFTPHKLATCFWQRWWQLEPQAGNEKFKWWILRGYYERRVELSRKDGCISIYRRIWALVWINHTTAIRSDRKMSDSYSCRSESDGERRFWIALWATATISPLRYLVDQKTFRVLIEVFRWLSSLLFWLAIQLKVDRGLAKCENEIFPD